MQPLPPPSSPYGSGTASYESAGQIDAQIGPLLRRFRDTVRNLGLGEPDWVAFLARHLNTEAEAAAADQHGEQNQPPLASRSQQPRLLRSRRPQLQLQMQSPNEAAAASLPAPIRISVPRPRATGGGKGSSSGGERLVRSCGSCRVVEGRIKVKWYHDGDSKDVHRWLCNRCYKVRYRAKKRAEKAAAKATAKVAAATRPRRSSRK